MHRSRPSAAVILNLRIHGDRSYAEVGGTLVQAIAADNSIVEFRNNAPEAGMGEPRRQ
jgi:hypothetical protein